MTFFSWDKVTVLGKVGHVLNTRFEIVKKVQVAGNSLGIYISHGPNDLWGPMDLHSALSLWRGIIIS